MSDYYCCVGCGRLLPNDEACTCGYVKEAPDPSATIYDKITWSKRHDRGPASAHALGDTPYGLAALRDECAEVAGTSEGQRNDRLNIAATRMGSLIGAGQLTEATARAALNDAGLKCGLPQREVDLVLRDDSTGGLTVGQQSPRDVAELPPLPVPARLGAETRVPGWAPVDLSATIKGLVDGTLELPIPAIGNIEGGTALFYPGTINGIAGESGSGKSWTGLACCAQEIARGQSVVYIDYEDHATSVVGRLLALGAKPDDILGLFEYINPATRFDQTAADSLRRTLCVDEEPSLRPSFVVIDSTGEALAMDGANPNADDEVAAWFGKVRWIAAQSGAAVLVLDHTTKASGNEGMWPIGSQRKRAAITGAQYMQRSGRPFSRTQEGSAKLICAKDRHGHYSIGQHVADLVVIPQGQIVSLSLRAVARATGEGQVWRPTGYMEKVSRALELTNEALSGNGVCERVSGKKGYVLTALSTLVAEGYVATAPGPRNSTLHTSVKPYREDEDPREPVDAENGPLTGSTGSGSLGGEPGTSDGTGSGNQPGTGRELVESEPPSCVRCGQKLLLTIAGRDECEQCRVAEREAVS